MHCLQETSTRAVVFTHSSSNKLPISEAFQLVLLLLPPNPGRRPCAVKYPVNINPHYVLIVLDLAADHGSLRPGYTRIGNEDVQSVIEYSDLRDDGFVDGFGIADVDLVRST